MFCGREQTNESFNHGQSSFHTKQLGKVPTSAHSHAEFLQHQIILNKGEQKGETKLKPENEKNSQILHYSGSVLACANDKRAINVLKSGSRTACGTFQFYQRFVHHPCPVSPDRSFAQRARSDRSP